jgi:hypothetical protein
MSEAQQIARRRGSEAEAVQRDTGLNASESDPEAQPWASIWPMNHLRSPATAPVSMEKGSGAASNRSFNSLLRVGLCDEHAGAHQPQAGKNHKQRRDKREQNVDHRAEDGSDDAGPAARARDQVADRRRDD